MSNVQCSSSSIKAEACSKYRQSPTVDKLHGEKADLATNSAKPKSCTAWLVEVGLGSRPISSHPSHPIYPVPLFAAVCVVSFDSSVKFFWMNLVSSQYVTSTCTQACTVVHQTKFHMKTKPTFASSSPFSSLHLLCQVPELSKSTNFAERLDVKIHMVPTSRGAKASKSPKTRMARVNSNHVRGARIREVRLPDSSRQID